MKKNILVLCTGNSCRSQMAHGYLAFYAKEKANVFSAGVETHGLNPKAVFFMQEDGIDISHHTSNNVLEYVDMNFDYVITVCDNAKETCPYFPTNATIYHHNFEDPSKVKGNDDEITASFRKVRNEIKQYCKEFIEEHLAK